MVTLVVTSGVAWTDSNFVVGVHVSFSIPVLRMIDQTRGRLVQGDILMISFVVCRATFDTRHITSRSSEQSAYSLHQSKRQRFRELIRFPSDRSLNG